MPRGLLWYSGPDAVELTRLYFNTSFNDCSHTIIHHLLNVSGHMTEVLCSDGQFNSLCVVCACNAGEAALAAMDRARRTKEEELRALERYDFTVAV